MERNDILAEIRHTAAENGGRPLRAKRFSQETGISEADWLGKHWARWGDALRAAGFDPNTLQGTLEEDEILRRYAELVREIGPVPVWAELEMKHHQESAFPAWQTYARRLGGHRETAVPRLVE
jgi:hypothetical protein